MKKKTGIEVRVRQGLDKLSQTVAERIIEIAGPAIRERGRFCLNLSGGSTPRRLYALLAGEFKKKIAWTETHLFWGDERYVPRDDSRSNYRMVLETMLTELSIPPANIHSVPVDMSPIEAAAESYESHLRDFFGADRQSPGYTFDVTLLGMGEDGHTASLFPGSSALRETERWAVAVTAPRGIEPPQRITMTLPLLNRSNHVFFLVSGERKRPAALSILKGEAPESKYPAALVQAKREVVWYVDSNVMPG
jgi:6-phosphogluconolactonase